MHKVSRVHPGYKIGLGLAGLGILVMFTPEIIQLFAPRLQENPLIRNLPESLVPEAAHLRASNPVDTGRLLAQLEEGDQQWEPQEQVMPDGSTRYLYKRRADEPDLSVSQLRAMVDNPPTFEQERSDILELLATLQHAGVRVVLAPTLKSGAAGEWDHQQATLRIQPDITKKGSVDFLRVLSHEAVHVAQSCRAGSIRAKPTALGLAIADSGAIQNKLNDPVYADASQWEKKLEVEAYGTQNNSDVVSEILKSQCRSALEMPN
jgi:hypothetical protein